MGQRGQEALRCVLHVLQGAGSSTARPERHLEARSGVGGAGADGGAGPQGPGAEWKSLGFLLWAVGSHRGCQA